MQFTLSKQYSPIRQAITANYRLDEKSAVDSLVKTLDFSPEQEQRITDNAIKLLLVKNILTPITCSWNKDLSISSQTDTLFFSLRVIC